MSQKRKALDSGGYVYVIDGGSGLVKVGRSLSPQTRINGIASSGGFKIQRQWVSPAVAYHSKLELKSHEELAQYRVLGEWFSCSFEMAVATVTRLVPEFAECDEEAEAKARLQGEENMRMIIGAFESQKQKVAFERAVKIGAEAVFMQKYVRPTVDYLCALYSPRRTLTGDDKFHLMERITEDPRIITLESTVHMFWGRVMEIHHQSIGEAMSLFDFIGAVKAQAELKVDKVEITEKEVYEFFKATAEFGLPELAQ